MYYLLILFEVDGQRMIKKENFKGVLSEEFRDKSNVLSTTLLFNNVMVHSLELSERAMQSTKHNDVAIKGLQMMIDKIDYLEIEDPKENYASLTSQVDLQNSDFERNQVTSNTSMTLWDPPFMVTKGHLQLL